jgi:hypothetical protein
MALTNKLTAIADSIRDKTGTTDKLTLDQMPQAIANIETGGSSGGGGVNSCTLDDFFNDNNIGDVVDSSTIMSVIVKGKKSISSISYPNVTVMGGESYPFLNTGKAGNDFVISMPKLQKTYGSYTFYGTNATRIDIPALTFLGTNSVYSCHYIKYLYLPSATTIMNSAIMYCSLLTSLVLPGETMCELSSSSNFTNTPIKSGTGYIYVPQSLIEDYKVATNWSLYADQFRAIEDYPEICGEVDTDD